MNCPICKVEMIEARPEHITGDGFHYGNDNFPTILTHTIKYYFICPKCKGEVIKPETKYYYPKEK